MSGVDLYIARWGTDPSPHVNAARFADDRPVAGPFDSVEIARRVLEEMTEREGRYIGTGPLPFAIGALTRHGLRVVVPLAGHNLRFDGRRWFQRSFGNTYHRTHVTVDGRPLFTTPITYGYGGHYVQTAWEFLHKRGYLGPSGLEPHPNGSHEGVLQQLARLRVRFEHDVVDVPRKRDL